VLANLAKDPISSHFSDNECIYRKELFHRYHCIIALGHKLVTLLIASMGGDIGGWGTVSQNLRWGDGPCIRPPPIFGEVVLLEAWQSTNRL